MRDENAVEGFRRALERRGHWVLIRRVSGNAPSSTNLDAEVRAIVTGYKPQQPVGSASGDREAAITLGARMVLVSAADLKDRRFPLPVKKNDKVVLNDDKTKLGTGTAGGDEELNVMSADPNTRHIAGAIELVAEGV